MKIAEFATPTESRELVESILNEIGRPVSFYYPVSLSGCSLCTLDPISNTSTDSFCPSCSGEYWIPTYSGVTYSGKVTWGYSEKWGWETGGKLDYGDCTVTIMHTEDSERVVFSSEFVTVDGRNLNRQKVILRGVPEVNRILVVLKEKERG